MLDPKSRVPPKRFEAPTSLPESDADAASWQKANQNWWQNNPMRYDWREKLADPEGSEGFFREIDSRFFSDVRRYMPWKKTPFDPLIDFEALRGMDVLEIGVGSGAHAQLLARNARSFAGIDLTDAAIESVRSRFEGAGLDTTGLARMDAEHMTFPDHSFDFIWSWGVIHHSSNTRRILEEMHRVLRPGGRAITMVYHRNVWNWYFVGGFLHGVLGGDLRRTHSLHVIAQMHTDGALARFYTKREWAGGAADLFRVKRVWIFGSKAEVVPIPPGKIKRALLRWIPDAATRFLTNRMGFGTYLVTELTKI
jgi:ubiquinone/menaquinone biosynthesis C-methylase UbiE